MTPKPAYGSLRGEFGIDATRPFGQASAEKLVMSETQMDWARPLADRISRV